MKRNNNWVSASDIGQACYCPKALAHKYAGTEVSTSAIAARKRGNETHDALNREAEDKRCFVASHVWGITDPRTECLRQFRDQHLMPHRAGRCLVRLYYRISPSVVDAARHCRPLDLLLRQLVTGFAARLKRETIVSGGHPERS